MQLGTKYFEQTIIVKKGCLVWRDGTRLARTVEFVDGRNRPEHRAILKVPREKLQFRIEGADLPVFCTEEGEEHKVCGHIQHGSPNSQYYSETMTFYLDS